MKKSVLFAMFLGGVFAANAQATATDKVQLRVTLSPIQTIVVNASQKPVKLNYATVNDYNDGVTSVNENHLTIYSTGGFEVKVKSDEDNLSNSDNLTTIASNTITLTPSAGVRPLGGTVTHYTPVTLSKAGKTLITSNAGGFDKTVHVNYAGAGLQAYINNYETGKSNIFTTNVTYTIVAN